jgi:hypothetical protein
MANLGISYDCIQLQVDMVDCLSDECKKTFPVEFSLVQKKLLYEPAYKQNMWVGASAPTMGFMSFPSSRGRSPDLHVSTGSIDIATHPDADAKAHGGVIGNKAGSPRADKRQRDSDNRKQSHNHSHIDDDMEQHER